MTKKFIISSTLVLISLVAVAYLTGQWQAGSEWRATRPQHDTLVSRMEVALTQMLADPHCPFGINKPIPEGSYPECGNHMFWYEKDYDFPLTLHFARLESLNYDISQGLNIMYLKGQLDDFFHGQGFVGDDLNTRSLPYWSEIYPLHIFAYTRADLKCSWSVKIDTEGRGDIFPPFSTITCGTITPLDREIFSDYVTLANPLLADERPFWLDAREGDYARLSVGYVSSSYFLAHRVDGKWELIYGPSQEYPLCSDIDMYDIPQSIYRDCHLPDFSLRETTS